MRLFRRSIDRARTWQPSDAMLLDTRRRLRQHAWGSDSLPTGDVAVTESWDGFSRAGVARVDRLIVSSILGLSFEAWLLYPTAAAVNRLFCWHGGHGQDQGATPSTEYWGYFIDRGYHVLAMSMPLAAPNPTTVEVTLSGGPVEITGTLHNGFSAIEDDGYPALRIFLDQPVRALGHALSVLTPDVVAIGGISGGGWTTDFWAAVDDRPTHVYSVAGSIPFDIQVPGDDGDFEQSSSRPHFQIAEHRNLYALAGLGRRAVQILNEEDTCCFAAEGRHAAIEAYEADVQLRLLDGALGDFHVRLDATDGPCHCFSADARAFVHADLGG